MYLSIKPKEINVKIPQTRKCNSYCLRTLELENKKIYLNDTLIDENIEDFALIKEENEDMILKFNDYKFLLKDNGIIFYIDLNNINVDELKSDYVLLNKYLKYDKIGIDSSMNSIFIKSINYLNIYLKYKEKLGTEKAKIEILNYIFTPVYNAIENFNLKKSYKIDNRVGRFNFLDIVKELKNNNSISFYKDKKKFKIIKDPYLKIGFRLIDEINKTKIDLNTIPYKLNGKKIILYYYD